MSEEDYDHRRFRYSSNQPDGIPEGFPKPDKVFVLIDVFHSKGGSFQRLLDCAGVRYVLLLEFNKHVDNCLENTLLQRMYQGFEEEDITSSRIALSDVSKDCTELFWPYLNRDFENRTKNGTLMDPIHPLEYDRSDSHKLQLKTINGSLCAVEHATHLDNRTEHFHNPYPDLRCFQKSEIEILETITMKIFRVRIQGEEYVLKTGPTNLLPEIAKLRALSPHRNVLGLTGVLVDAEGRIMGMLTPFIQGKSLSNIRSATVSQKQEWKAKISNAVQFLHEENITWGDAAAHNILISSATDEPVLIDFEAFEEWETEGWVDQDLHISLEGDLKALQLVLKYIDEIPTSEV